MDEREWLACRSPYVLLRHIRSQATGRKWRLFNCACCRQVWSSFADERGRSAVEAIEAFVDERLGSDEVYAALAAAAHARADGGAECRAMGGRSFRPAVQKEQTLARWANAYALRAAASAFSLNGASAWESWVAARWTLNWGSRQEKCKALNLRRQARQLQCAILRDIFGNPFRSGSAIGPSVLRWSDSIVKRLAEQAYDQRCLPTGQLDNARLAILADALEEAGITDQDILGHLRHQGAVHVRGCAVLDQLLAKG